MDEELKDAEDVLLEQETDEGRDLEDERRPSGETDRREGGETAETTPESPVAPEEPEEADTGEQS